MSRKVGKKKRNVPFLGDFEMLSGMSTSELSDDMEDEFSPRKNFKIEQVPWQKY